MGRKLDRYLDRPWAPGRFRVEFEGLSIGAERDTTNGNRYTGIVEIEDGQAICWELGDPVDDHSPSNVWDHDFFGSGSKGSAILDRIAPYTKDRLTPNTFRRIAPELAAAIRAADPTAEARRNSPRQLALDLAERVPAGVRKEDFLPFVTAVLQYLGAAQGQALDRDEPAASFGIAGEQIRYLADFRRLAGRDFDPTADRVTRAEVDALPITPRSPAPDPRHECLECGAVFDEPGHIEGGGMGCVRCNGEARRDWKRHLVTA